jgi:predicted enzyme related to lactoylglutathione lyase
MNPKKLFPLVVTDRLAETKAFYVDKAGFKIQHDMDGYLQVIYGDADGPELAFAASESEVLGKMPRFGGEGIIVSIPTPDADRKAREMESRGVKLMGEPVTRPWGWRSFMTTDPNGVILDFFHVPADNAGANATG